MKPSSDSPVFSLSQSWRFWKDVHLSSGEQDRTSPRARVLPASVAALASCEWARSCEALRPSACQEAVLRGGSFTTRCHSQAGCPGRPFLREPLCHVEAQGQPLAPVCALLRPLLNSGAALRTCGPGATWQAGFLKFLVPY